MFKWRWKRINALQYGLRNLWLVSVPMDCLFICFDFRFTLSHTDTHIVDCHKHMSETLMLRLSITSLRSSSLVPYSTMRIAWGFDTQCCTFMCVHLLCMPMWLWIWTNERLSERVSVCVNMCELNDSYGQLRAKNLMESTKSCSIMLNTLAHTLTHTHAHYIGTLSVQ